MYPEPQEDVIDKQLVCLVGMAKRWHHHTSKTGNRDIVHSHRLMFQIANSWSVGVVGDRVQRAARQIKKQNVVGLVETRDRIAFQIMDASLTGTHVGNGYYPAFFPILASGKITKRQRDEKSIFARERTTHFFHRNVAPRLCDGHFSRA